MSAEELRHLNAWPAGRQTAVRANGRGSAKPVFYANGSERKPTTARISGSFRGWTGKTCLTLDNDQVWQQAESGSFGNIEISNTEMRASS